MWDMDHGDNALYKGVINEIHISVDIGTDCLATEEDKRQQSETESFLTENNDQGCLSLISVCFYHFYLYFATS